MVQLYTWLYNCKTNCTSVQVTLQLYTSLYHCTPNCELMKFGCGVYVGLAQEQVGPGKIEAPGRGLQVSGSGLVFRKQGYLAH